MSNLRYCKDLLFDVDFYNHDNEKLIKNIYENLCLFKEQIQNPLLICKFNDELVNISSPYKFIFDNEYKSMDFIFYRNTFDILKDYNEEKIIQDMADAIVESYNR